MIDLTKPPTVSDALARLAIQNCIARQALGNDMLDAKLWKSAFWPEATENHAWYEGNAYDFVDATIPMLKNEMDATWHQLGPPFIVVEATTARAVTCFYAYCRLRNEMGKNVDLRSGGRYVDRFECRDGDWRILSRVTKGDWVREDPATFDYATSSFNGYRPVLGMRGADDPARVLFELGSA